VRTALLSSFGFTYEIFIDILSGICDYKLRIAVILDLLQYWTCCTIGLATLLRLAALFGLAARLYLLRFLDLLHSIRLAALLRLTALLGLASTLVLLLFLDLQHY
jgi:hypothetical protein